MLPPAGEEIVDAEDLVALGEQPLAKMRADKPGARRRSRGDRPTALILAKGGEWRSECRAGRSVAGEPSCRTMKAGDAPLVYQGWTRLSRVVVRFADGQSVSREVEAHGDGAAVLAYDPARRTAILVRQFRASAFIAAGEAGPIGSDCRHRRGRRPGIDRQARGAGGKGLRLGPMERVGTGWSMPGLSTERMHFFLAEYSQKNRVGAGGGLADERASGSRPSSCPEGRLPRPSPTARSPTSRRCSSSRR